MGIASLKEILPPGTSAVRRDRGQASAEADALPGPGLASKVEETRSCESALDV